MTYSDSLSRIKRNVNPKFWNTEDIEHYNNIVNALEKQIPKKPIDDRYPWSICPACGGSVNLENVIGYIQNKEQSHCEHCGQAIDWSDTK
ncbi:MAG: hypothetical protein J6Q39_08205 [Bacteroidales bacterium]|nr:hypothetical protein [Bacteroidales bacterium]